MHALTVVVGTKASYWLTNHHTGGQSSTLSSYICKVVLTKYDADLTHEFVRAVHTVGHWASTKAVLRCAGIKNILPVDPFYTPKGPLSLSSDARLRFEAMPAGTHRLAVGYEAASRLARSKEVLLTPSPDNFISLATLREEVMANPASFHIGAQYLTGQNRSDYDDVKNEGVLGRLGTYVLNVIPKSTLAASPHLDPARIQSYPDYNADYATTLQQLKLVEM